MRTIAIIIESKDYLDQCVKGLKWLRRREKKNLAEVTVHLKNERQHTENLLGQLQAWSEEGAVDVVIAGAGKAAALPGLIDSYLRHQWRNGKIAVFGVAFKGKTINDTLAASLSITQVPGTQAIYIGQGQQGFYDACVQACRGSLPEIKLPETPATLDLSLDEAIELTEK